MLITNERPSCYPKNIPKASTYHPAPLAYQVLFGCFSVIRILYHRIENLSRSTVEREELSVEAMLEATFGEQH